MADDELVPYDPYANEVPEPALPPQAPMDLAQMFAQYPDIASWVSSRRPQYATAGYDTDQNLAEALRINQFDLNKIKGLIPPDAAASGYSGPKDWRSIYNYYRGSNAATGSDPLAGLLDLFKAQGLNASRATHAGNLPSEDKLILDGRMMDFGSSLGSPSGVWFDDPLFDDGGGGSVGNALGLGGIDPSYLAPFTKPFPMGGAGSDLPNYAPPNAFTFDDFPGFKPFNVGTVWDILNNDPGYEFRRAQGQKGVEAAAAARGLLNSGGTLADILGFNQNMASQEADMAFNRAFNLWNQGNLNDLTAYNTRRANAADIYNTNYGTQFVDPYSFGTTKANTLYNRAQDQWMKEKDLWFQNQREPFGKIFDLAQLGLNAASQSPVS